MAHPPLENRKKTKGWQRRENKESRQRQVTFSKRKAGLMKKAAELAMLCHAKVVIVVFSEAGKAFAFASPSVDAVLGCGDGDVSDAPGWEALEALRREAEEKRAEVKAEVKRMSAVGKKVPRWWS